MAIENKEINVEGMHCPSCKLAVEMSLKDLDGVEDAVADYETGKVKVELDSDKVSDADLSGAVDEAGFKML